MSGGEGGDAPTSGDAWTGSSDDVVAAQAAADMPFAPDRTAVLQPWNEHESGWGIRPDGWSLHVDAAQHAAYLEARDRAPEGDEFDRPDGMAYPVRVDEATFARLRDSRLGLRRFGPGAHPPDRGALVIEAPEDLQDAADYLQRLHELHGRR